MGPLCSQPGGCFVVDLERPVLQYDTIVRRRRLAGDAIVPDVPGNCFRVALQRIAETAAAGLPVVIASSDKDFFQLINPNVHLLNPNDKTDTLWQAEQVRAKTGVEPTQIIDWLSLVGDAVDGIPGVRGVGPKTATKLLLEYGTVENLYSNLDAVKPDGLQGRLREAMTEVQRNQELVALREIPEWKIKLEELRPGAGDYATLHAQYTRWNFRSLLQELEAGRQGELL